MGSYTVHKFVLSRPRNPMFSWMFLREKNKNPSFKALHIICYCAGTFRLLRERLGSPTEQLKVPWGTWIFGWMLGLHIDLAIGVIISTITWWSRPYPLAKRIQTWGYLCCIQLKADVADIKQNLVSVWVILQNCTNTNENIWITLSEWVRNWLI